MHVTDQAALAALIGDQRQAALGTLADGIPFVSMVLYALEHDPSGQVYFLIHVSRLAPHTRQLISEPRASLLIARPDCGDGDPQALPRVTVQVNAQPLPADNEEYVRARTSYLARLPGSALLFTFPDFTLFRLMPNEARYTGGFARAFDLTADQLQAALRLLRPGVATAPARTEGD